jgi:hypothetical protein
MSFIHYTLVGYFDPRTVWTSGSPNLVIAKPMNPERVRYLLAEYSDAVASHVTIQDGYVRCQWAPAPREASDQIIEFAYRLARQAECVAVENGRQVTYPPEAARAQAEVWESESGPVRFADSCEQQARRQAEAFGKRMRR